MLNGRKPLAKAFEIACWIRHPVADCLNLACAEASGAVLLTDDISLGRKAQALGARVKVILLNDWAPGLPVTREI